MKKFLLILAAAVMLCIFSFAAADESPILGKPFPEFHFLDTAQKIQTLSGLAEGRDAVLINLWTSWCHPCKIEYPYLNTAYEKYKDRVAFIGLSVDPEDTLYDITEIKRDYHLAYPVGKEEHSGILDYLGGSHGTPTTIILDRFGNAVFFKVGAFADASQLDRLMDVFLADNYTESRPLTAVPMPSETGTYPVGAKRRLWIENEDARELLLTYRGSDEETGETWETKEPGWVVGGDTVPLAMELGPRDDITDVVFNDTNNEKWDQDMWTLLDRERNLYTYDMPIVPGTAFSTFYYVSLGSRDGSPTLDTDYITMTVFPNEDAIADMVEYYAEDGTVLTWEYAEKSEQPAVPEKEAAYILHVVDQYREAVPGVTVTFCTDVMCMPAASDENGLITFTGEKKNYHVQVVRAPEGYSFDPEYELQTGAGYGEWVLVVRKN